MHIWPALNIREKVAARTVFAMSPASSIAAGGD
jgi:hypothetical protein